MIFVKNIFHSSVNLLDYRLRILDGFHQIITFDIFNFF
jgi:hypothetical protein